MYSFSKVKNVPYFSKYERSDGKIFITSCDRKINGRYKNVFEVSDSDGNVIETFSRLKDAKVKYSMEDCVR